MFFTIWQHLALAWGAFALLVIFALWYCPGERTHRYDNQGLLLGYLITASVTIWPLMTAPIWRFAAIVPLGAMVVGLSMIRRGNKLEQTSGTARIPNDDGGQHIGNGGGVAIAGLLLGLVLFTVAAFFIEAATFFKS